MKKWIYLSILVAGAVTLAVCGWIVQGVRAPFLPARRPALKAV